MSTTLKDGSVVQDPRLDRIYEEDWASLSYPVTRHPRMLGYTAPKPPRSYTWSLNQWLDQGREGACVSTGTSHELAATPVPVTGLTMTWARETVYWPAQRIDQWPGGAYPGAQPFYEGTSVLSGMKILADHGYYTSYYWALDLQQLVMGVGYAGPAVVGFNWYEGMYNTDANGFIAPTEDLAGGHCLLALGVKIAWKTWVNIATSRNWENVDHDKSYLLLHNSWGKDWGVDGRAKITLRDADRLLNEQGDAGFGVRNPNLKVAA